MDGIMTHLLVFLRTFQIIKGHATELIKWSSEGIITNVRKLKALETMYELHELPKESE